MMFFDYGFCSVVLSVLCNLWLLGRDGVGVVAILLCVNRGG